MSEPVPSPDEWDDERFWDGEKERLRLGTKPFAGQLPPVEFRTFGQRIAGHRERRLAIGRAAMSFGVGYLDHALGGIMPNDLVLLTGSTGVGKTQLATLIAQYNAYRRRRVHYLALEAAENEIEDRLLYRVVVDRMYRLGLGDERLNYLDWSCGRCDDLTAEHERAVDAELAEAFKTLHTFYRVRDFTGEAMVRLLRSVQADTDLVILDHLHYIDSDDSNENRGFRLIVKQLRDTALEIGKPVVVVVHIRKAERGRSNRTLLPSLDDIHGTSDTPKIATKSIAVARAVDVEERSPYLVPTYMQALKCRSDGGRTRYVGRMRFDVRHNGYEREFALGQAKPGKDGETFEALPIVDWPAWANHAPKFHYPEEPR